MEKAPVIKKAHLFSSKVILLICIVTKMKRIRLFCSSKNENKLVGHERIQSAILTSDGVSTVTNPAGGHCELMGREVRVSSYASLTCSRQRRSTTFTKRN